MKPRESIRFHPRWRLRLLFLDAQTQRLLRARSGSFQKAQRSWVISFGCGASPHCPPASRCSRNISDQEGVDRLTSLGLLLQRHLSLDCTVRIHVLPGVPFAWRGFPSRTEALPVMNLRQGFRRMREQPQRRLREASLYTVFKEPLCGPNILLQWTAHESPKNAMHFLTTGPSAMSPLSPGRSCPATVPAYCGRRSGRPALPGSIGWRAVHRKCQ